MDELIKAFKKLTKDIAFRLNSEIKDYSTVRAEHSNDARELDKKITKNRINLAAAT